MYSSPPTEKASILPSLGGYVSHAPKRFSTMRFCFISIRSAAAAAIVEGRKVVEYRRIAPALAAPYPVLLYATGREGRIVAACEVNSVLRGDAETIVNATIAMSHPSAHDPVRLRAYLQGAQRPAALLLGNVVPNDSIKKADLQRLEPGFRVPENFRYIGAESRIGRLVLRQFPHLAPKRTPQQHALFDGDGYR